MFVHIVMCTYVCLYIYKELFLPIMHYFNKQSFYHRFWNSVKSTSGKLYMFIVTKNILYIYIYMTETYCVHMFSESGYILAIR